MKTREAIVILGLTVLLSLGACSNATTQEQTTNNTQADSQSQVESEAKPSMSAAAERQSIKLEGVGNARQLGGCWTPA